MKQYNFYFNSKFYLVKIIIGSPKKDNILGQRNTQKTQAWCNLQSPSPG